MTEKDKKLKDALLRDDKDAWTRLTMQMALSIMRNKHYVEWLEKNCHSVEEVTSELYARFHKNNFHLIRAIEGSINAWLIKQVLSAVETVIDPKYRSSGGKIIEDSHPGGGIEGDSEDLDQTYSIENVSRKDLQELSNSSYDTEAHENLAQKEDADKNAFRDHMISVAFSKFWKMDPRAAYALLWNQKFGMTYEEIGRFFGEKGNTVQQWVYRSRGWWQEELKKIDEICHKRYS